jgi:hypothetical protein
MKKKYRFLKIIFVAGIWIFLLRFSLQRFNNRPVEDIVVKMLQKEPVSFINDKIVREIIRRENPTNRIGDLNILSLERAIRAMPMVDSANVYLKLNGQLNLDISQRIPIFRLSKKDQSFYVDEKGVEFPASNNYSYQCMLVSGKVGSEEYPMLVELVKIINRDDFSKNFFVGISKKGNDYYLMTNEGNYVVELGRLENLGFKIKGFKTFVEKYLIYQDQMKYSKISLKYDNQIVTTLRKGNEDKESKERVYKPEEKSKEEVKKDSDTESKKEETKPKSEKSEENKDKKK